MRIKKPLSAQSLGSILLSSAVLISCVPAQSEPTPAPVPAKAAQPAAPAPPPPVAVAATPAVSQPSGEWTDWPITPGNWVYRQDARGSIALFGQPDVDATFIIRCDQARNMLFLSREGTVAENAQMTLRASSGLQTFPARNSGGPANYAAIMIPPDDYMMDRIIFSRGRFAVETSGLRSLAIPIWPEFTRVVEDCRR